MARMRLRWIAAIFCAVLCFSLSACRKNDMRTIDVSVPQMKNEACAKKIAEAIYRLGGIQRESLQFDLAKRSASLTYDSMVLARKNIEFAIANAGFAANEVPANAEAAAKLPDECR